MLKQQIKGVQQQNKTMEQQSLPTVLLTGLFCSLACGCCVTTGEIIIPTEDSSVSVS
jgi:hypothetical protein